MSINKKIKNQTIRRVKIVAGQVQGLAKMINDEKYCVDIINQSFAIKQALSGIEDLILENHLTTHASHQMKTSKKSRTIKEILDIYKLSKRK